MNCKQCNAPLQQGARFCPNCGTPTDAGDEQTQRSQGAYPASVYDPTNPLPPQPGVSGQNQAPWAATQPVASPMQSSPWAPTQDVTGRSAHNDPQMSPLQQSPPLQYYQTNNSDRGTQMPPDNVKGSSAARPARRRNRAGCLVGCLSVLVLLLLVVGAGWLFLARPYLHNMAQTQLDRAMSAGIQQIPPTVIALPPGTLPVGENAINNLIVLNLAPSDPIKNPNTQIASDGMHISFQVYGFACTVSAKPALQNGRLVATNVQLDGPISWIMSPDELTPLLNQRLSDAQDKLRHPIQSVQLMNHEMDLILGSPLAV